VDFSVLLPPVWDSRVNTGKAGSEMALPFLCTFLPTIPQKGTPSPFGEIVIFRIEHSYYLSVTSKEFKKNRYPFDNQTSRKEEKKKELLISQGPIPRSLLR
jgi:hypothetical protein